MTNLTNVTTVYNETVIVMSITSPSTATRVGIAARPSPEEERAEHERHRGTLTEQTRHEHMASQNKQNFASKNHGRPAFAATAKPGEFKERGVVGAKAAGAA